MPDPEPHKLDYETPPPTPRRIGLLSRTNPKATARSVLRRSLLTVITATILWGVCLWLRPNPKWQPTWSAFAAWLTIAAGVGAIYEWQVVEDDDV